jgi:DNA-binding NarL/FixJ family response regulator
MPRMLVDIVKDVIASHEDIEVAGEIEGHTGLLAAAIQTQADVVVLREPAGSASEIYRELLHGRPRLKILAITADGRRGFLHHLQPRVVALGELSPSSLIDAIRNGSRTAGAVQ